MIKLNFTDLTNTYLPVIVHVFDLQKQCIPILSHCIVAKVKSDSNSSLIQMHKGATFF